MTNGSSSDPQAAEPRPVSQDANRPVRKSDPMSFASILSSSNQDTVPPASAATNGIANSMTQPEVHHMKSETTEPRLDFLKSENRKASAGTLMPAKHETLTNGLLYEAPKPVLLPRKTLSGPENDKVRDAMAQIEEALLSDVESPGFDEAKEKYEQRRRKRGREQDETEHSKRKVSYLAATLPGSANLWQQRRHLYLLDQTAKALDVHVKAGTDRFRSKNEGAALHEVQQKDINDEKERKKDMQRKRRREHALRTETLKMEEWEQKAKEAADPIEQDKYLKLAEKCQLKVRDAQNRLEGGGGADDFNEVQPPAPNFEGGSTSTFQVAASPEPPRKKARQSGPNTRPKKSKEQKRAEIESAFAAHAAQERDDLVRIAPKDEPRKDGRSKGSRKSAATAITQVANYDSKGYQQIYEQIWRDIARKDVPKVVRIKNLSTAIKTDNMRKTAILASKQARKWQERTNKSTKDTQARAKRVMREMMSFWKRNEREERDLRRMAERKEIEDARKAEADREANRQKRKLNFLISQTELYSHFIGRKIKTDEVERATDDPEVAAAGQKLLSGQDDAHTIDLPSSVADLTGKTKVTNFEDLDFDADDDEVLKRAAMANAQSAIQEAQDKARAFNGESQMDAFDNSDMNFQNPTMMGDVEVAQPKMLQAQLKEYQLKGLNWLVNLYEQGINGILADEMGLGKTVQSISVMGYLAEQHNIWGPFLVIAPSSTLHNWQQEITRFVPTLKVLPYWGSAKDRKVLRKFWDRKHITYNKDSEFHVLVTSYQLVVQDAQYFQKIKWQYMILDEAQAIKSSNSTRWKILLGFHCRNRLLLTGTPIQNNMQELWALLHFIMPSLFDSHDEFSDWFSKDIESHAQSNTKLNQDQLRRLHMILKPFMLRRVKAHVQKELGDKVEKDVFCDLTYRQRAYYSNLRSRISIMDLIEKATLGDDQDTATLMNLVMQFRKVCNHPDLFERADTASPFSFSHFAETASFLREGSFVQLKYSVRNLIEYDLPRILCDDIGRINFAGPNNTSAGTRSRILGHMMNIWDADYIKNSAQNDGTCSFLRFIDMSPAEVSDSARAGLFDRAVKLQMKSYRHFGIFDDSISQEAVPVHAMLNIVENNRPRVLGDSNPDSHLSTLLNISRSTIDKQGIAVLEPAARPRVTAPPIQINASDQSSITERELDLFNGPMRNALYPIDLPLEESLIAKDVDPSKFPVSGMLPQPTSLKSRFTNISVPSMRRFVTDSGKLAKLDQLLRELKNGGHRVLLYFQMTRMIDLMEEYLTYRNYKYCRLDGSTKLEDRRDTVHDFQTRPEIFIFLLSTRAGGLGINLTAADTVIFYDSDWNPTIDSQAMDRAHRLGQTRQVTVYRMITRGTIEERIRKRAMQKEEVQRVVITGGAGAAVDFNTRDRRENRTKDIALWLADDDQAALIEQKEKEIAEKPEEEVKAKRGRKANAAGAPKKKRGEVNLDDLYHEGNFAPFSH
jgi:DNA helicase INO80